MTSVEIIEMANGDLVSRVKGVQTCSFIDPRREAQEWVDHYRENIRERKTLVVLGIGSGYHLEELTENSEAHILAVEKQPALIESFRLRCPSLFNQGKIEAFNLDENGIEGLLSRIRPPFSVLTFAPTAYLDLPEFRVLFDVLCGRDSSERISGQFKMRGIQDFFMSSKMNLKSPAESYRQLAKDQSLSVRWRNVFRMMGELIR